MNSQMNEEPKSFGEILSLSFGLIGPANTFWKGFCQLEDSLNEDL